MVKVFKVQIHAPEYWFKSVGGGPAIGTGPMCNTAAQKPQLAEPHGDAINCKTCLRLLWGKAQWCNQLIAAGYGVPMLAVEAKRSRKRIDPKQLDFANLEDESETTPKM